MASSMYVLLSAILLGDVMAVHASALDLQLSGRL